MCSAMGTDDDGQPDSPPHNFFAGGRDVITMFQGQVSYYGV